MIVVMFIVHFGWQLCCQSQNLVLANVLFNIQLHTYCKDEVVHATANKSSE